MPEKNWGRVAGFQGRAYRKQKAELEVLRKFRERVAHEADYCRTPNFFRATVERLLMETDEALADLKEKKYGSD